MKNKQTTNRAPRLLSAAAFFLSANAAPLAAQTTDSASVSNSEVVELPGYEVKSSHLYTDQINALKTPTPIIDVPQSLSVIGSEEIELRGFDAIEDIVKYTPGVTMSAGEAHRDAIVFRGIRSTADFFVDGVRDDVQYYRPLYNVEQIEILRGPNALFFGRGGTGGILNRVMKKAQIGNDFKAFALGLDTFGAYDAQFDANVAINDSSAFRITTFYEHLENHRDFFDGERFGVTPTFKFLLSEKTTLDLTYEFLDHERFIDRGIPMGADNEPAESLKDITFGDPEFNTSTLEGHVFRAALQHRFSDVLKGNLTASYGTYDKYYGNYYANGYTAPDTVSLRGYGDQTDRDNFVLFGNLVSEFETGDIEHTFIVGSEFIQTNSDQFRFAPDFGGAESAPFSISGRDAPGTGFNAGGLPALNRLKDNTETDLTVYSLFVQDEVQLLEPLTLVLGLRYDNFDIDVEGFDDFGDSGFANLSGSQRDEFITPRLGIVYKPKENVSLYASYSQTFLPQSGETFADLGDEGLDPDEFTNLEAGIKWDFAERLSFTASVFELTQDNIVSAGAFSSETRETEIHGFEAQVNGRMTEQWFISAGYSYLDGEDANGDEPEEIATHQFSIWNRYQLTQKLGLGLGATYQDETISEGPTNVFVTLPSFVRVDAAAYYQLTENLRLQINIENLFDEVYFPHAHNAHEATVGAPIHARLSISGSF